MAYTTNSYLGGCTEDQYKEVRSVLDGDDAAATVLCKIFSTADRTDELAFGLDTGFLILSGALVFIMHGGFAMLEAGAIRSKNAMNILLQTVLDGAASAVMWYLVGFGFAYGIGDHPNGFIGDALFALSRYESHQTGTSVGNWTNWFFQWAFCATAATIPAGAVAERFNFNAYLGYSLFLGGFVYPVVAHWAWCPTGWLGYGNTSPLLGTGMIDFAGSGVVHMTGGLSGLIGAIMVGPRLGRFDMNGQPVPMPGHSAILVVLGTVMLWFGWYGFNPGSALVVSVRSSATVAGRAAVTTTLSGAAGGLTCLLLSVVRQVSWDLISLCNGMLVGFVAVTAGCHVVEPWAALLCGGSAALLFEGGCAALLRLRIDDVVSAGPMHGFCGAWGVLFVGLLAKEDFVKQAYQRDDYPYGLFYGGGGKLLACQVIGVLAIAGWVAVTMGPFFLAFKLAGKLRISAEEEHTGLDVSKHGGSAYNNAPLNTFGAFSALETLQQNQPLPHPHLMCLTAGTDPGVGGSLRQPQLIVHPVNSVAAKSVGDAIMRGNTLGVMNVSSRPGHNNPSYHHLHASVHSQGSTPGVFGLAAEPVRASPTVPLFAAAPGGTAPQAAQPLPQQHQQQPSPPAAPAQGPALPSGSTGSTGALVDAAAGSQGDGSGPRVWGPDTPDDGSGVAEVELARRSGRPGGGEEGSSSSSSSSSSAGGGGAGGDGGAAQD